MRKLFLATASLLAMTGGGFALDDNHSCPWPIKHAESEGQKIAMVGFSPVHDDDYDGALAIPLPIPRPSYHRHRDWDDRDYRHHGMRRHHEWRRHHYHDEDSDLD
jgi:hypothetical protein